MRRTKRRDVGTIMLRPKTKRKGTPIEKTTNPRGRWGRAKMEEGTADVVDRYFWVSGTDNLPEGEPNALLLDCLSDLIAPEERDDKYDCSLESLLKPSHASGAGDISVMGELDGLLLESLAGLVAPEEGATAVPSISDLLTTGREDAPSFPEVELDGLLYDSLSSLVVPEEQEDEREDLLGDEQTLPVEEEEERTRADSTPTENSEPTDVDVQEAVVVLLSPADDGEPLSATARESVEVNQELDDDSEAVEQAIAATDEEEPEQNAGYAEEEDEEARIEADTETPSDSVATDHQDGGYALLLDAIASTSHDATDDEDDEDDAMSETLAEVLLGLLPNGRPWSARAPRIRRKRKRRRGRNSGRSKRRWEESIPRVQIRHIRVKTRPLGKKKKKRKLTDFLPLLGLLIAVAIFAFPVVSDAYKQWAYTRTISEGYSYDWEDPKYQEILEQANLYNKMIAGRLPADVDVNTIWPYEKQLDYGAGGMIAWVEIPDLSLKLPIYHGSNDESLMAGVGHMERTSLPVGGDHTKCAISGHTGMQNERMFDSLDDLETDDIVIIHALGKDLYYAVTYKEVVEPTALDKLYIDCEDSQLVLITCTPRGINSHRLLVHAVQVEEESTQVANNNPMDAVMNYLLSPTVIFLTGMMFVLLVLFLLWLLRWRKKEASIKVQELDEYNALSTKLLEEGLDGPVGGANHRSRFDD